jgi:hypothetical protein
MDVLLTERTSDEENKETSAFISKCRNTGKRVCPASPFLRLINFVSQASAFRHKGQSGTAGHGSVRHCPAMLLFSIVGPLAIFVNSAELESFHDFVVT